MLASIWAIFTATLTAEGLALAKKYGGRASDIGLVALKQLTAGHDEREVLEEQVQVKVQLLLEDVLEDLRGGEKDAKEVLSAYTSSIIKELGLGGEG